MQMANIFSIENQKHYEHEKIVMILAHLLKAGKYESKYFDKNKYVILDNGLYEHSQVSINLQDIVDIAESQPIRVNEIIVPDVFQKYQDNISLFESNIPVIRKYANKYRFMFVVQASNYDEFYRALGYINNVHDLKNITIGIPKLSVVARDSPTAAAAYSHCVYPIHFLGIKNSFAELLPVAKYIRSCDSSQLMYIAAHVENIDDIDVINYSRTGANVDLDKIKVSDETIVKLLNKEKEGFAMYGVL